MLRYAFVSMMFGIAIPLAVTSVLSDLTLRKVLGFVAVLVAGAILFGVTKTSFYAAIQDWLAVDSRLVVLSCCLLGFIVLIGAAGPLLGRRRGLTLDWPRSVSQGDMQKLGAGYLDRRNWQVEPLDSFAGVSIYRCRKDALRMFCLFLKDPVPFERLLKNISRTPGVVLRNVVVVFYEKPAPGLVQALARSSMSAIFYKELDEVDALCVQVEENRRRGLAGSA